MKLQPHSHLLLQVSINASIQDLNSGDLLVRFCTCCLLFSFRALFEESS